MTIFQTWRGLINAKRELQRMQHRRYDLASELSAMANNVESMRKSYEQASDELKAIKIEIVQTTLSVDRAREIRRQTIRDARKLAISLISPLTAEKLRRAHKIATEIVDDAQDTANRIMAGAENYNEAILNLTPEEKAELMKEDRR